MRTQSLKAAVMAAKKAARWRENSRPVAYGQALIVTMMSSSTQVVGPAPKGAADPEPSATPDLGPLGTPSNEKTFPLHS